jgi:single-strand DNA-binding protein
MINRVVLVGRLTRDPEIRYTPSGVAMATMGIAVDKNLSRENQKEGEPTADFFNVVAWRHSAEFASNYLNKGRLVAIDGRLQQRSWVDQQGQKRSVVEVVADRLQGLDKREDGEGGGGPPVGGRSTVSCCVGLSGETPTGPGYWSANGSWKSDRFGHDL